MVRSDRCRSTTVFVFLPLLLVYLEGVSALTQTAASSSSFVELMKEAQSLYSDRKLDEAYLKFDAIRSLAHERHEELWEARGISGLAAVFYRQAKYPQARDKYLETLPVFERLGAREDLARVLLGLGNVAWFVGDRTDAKGRYHAAISLYEALGDVRSRDAATLNLLRMEPPGAAKMQETYEQLKLDANRLGDTNLEAMVLHQWGDALYTLAEYGAAIEKLERAASLFQQLNARNELAMVFNSLGRIYREHIQTAVALDYQLKALEIQESLQANASIIQSLNAVAVVYESLGKVDKAHSYYERAIALADKTGSPRMQDFLRANLAGFFINHGQFSPGADMMERVLSRGLDAYPSNRYCHLSFAYLNLARDRDALAAAQKAVDLCRAEGEAVCLHALYSRARAHLSLGSKPDAEADLVSAMTTLEDLHSKLVPEDFFKRELHHSWERLYSLAIELNYREGKGREALETAELARSRAFLDLLAAHRLDMKESSGRRQAQGASSSPTNPTGEGSFPPISRTGGTEVLRGAGTASIERQNPFMASQHGLASPVAVAAPTAPDISAIASRLRSTLVIYWVADDAVYTWVVNPKGVVFVERVAILRSRLQVLVRATSPVSPDVGTRNPGDLRSVRTGDGGAVAVDSGRAEAWGKLYNVLIRPIRKYLPSAPGARVTLVPHGPLLNLSFAALRDPGGRYLLEDYTLHYVPASAVLQFTALNHHSNARTGQILLVADPASPAHIHGGAPLPRLPGARAEASAIARLFPKSSVTFLTGTDATETRVREESAGKSVIHFATHAIVVDENPFDSYLALSPSADPATDGLFTAQKIYGINLDADMVILSACRSGSGLITGDGIAALGRAFFYGGTSTVVASLWNVPDKPTDRLLIEFYRAWRGGEDKDHALRDAQLEFLHELRAGKVSVNTLIGEVSVPEDPVFWAGFVLLGEPD